jgi:hypothetical protein
MSPKPLLEPPSRSRAEPPRRLNDEPLPLSKYEPLRLRLNADDPP